jgi:anti-sigma B factor antagonist
MSAAERAAPDVIRSVERVGSETTVTLCGELDVSTSAAVRDVLEEECARRPSVLKLDLVDVDFVDSSALHTFVIANKQLEPHGGVLRIVGVSEFIRRTFEITQLDRLFLPHANGNGNGRTARP